MKFINQPIADSNVISHLFFISILLLSILHIGRFKVSKIIQIIYFIYIDLISKIYYNTNTHTHTHHTLKRFQDTKIPYLRQYSVVIFFSGKDCKFTELLCSYLLNVKWIFLTCLD